MIFVRVYLLLRCSPKFVLILFGINEINGLIQPDSGNLLKVESNKFAASAPGLRPGPRSPAPTKPQQARQASAPALDFQSRESRVKRAGPPRRRSVADAENAAASAPALGRRRRESRSERAGPPRRRSISRAEKAASSAPSLRIGARYPQPRKQQRARQASAQALGRLL